MAMYTEEPLLRWLKDFCRTAAPYLPPWCQVVYTMISQCRKLKYDTLNFVKIAFQNFIFLNLQMWFFTHFQTQISNSVNGTRTQT